MNCSLPPLTIIYSRTRIPLQVSTDSNKSLHKLPASWRIVHNSNLEHDKVSMLQCD